MRAQTQIKLAMKRKLAADKVAKYKKDVTKGNELQFIADTLPIEEPVPETVGIFKPIREEKFIKGKKLKYKDRVKLDERIYSDPYADMAEKIKEKAAQDIKRFVKVKNAEKIHQNKIQEKAATGIQVFIKETN